MGVGGELWDCGVLVLRKEEKREWLNPKKRDSACRAREIPLEAGHPHGVRARDLQGTEALAFLGKERC